MFGQIDLVDALADDAGLAGHAVGHGLDSLGRTAAQGMHSNHMALADMGEQRTDGDLLRADRHIDPVGLDQVDIRRAVDQGNHLVRPHPLGQHGREDIGFVVVGQGAVDVGLADALFVQQILVGTVTDQHDGRVELFGDLLGAGRVALDDLEVMIALQALGQAGADIAAAGEQDPVDRFAQLAQLRHDRRDIARGRKEEDDIVDLDPRIAPGNDRLVAAKDGRDPGLDAFGQQLLERHQLTSHDRSVVIGPGGHQLGAAVGKIEDLQRAGVFDQSLEVIGDQLFGTDQHIDRRVLTSEQLWMVQIIGRADTRDLGRRTEQRIGDLTGHHVGFIGIGQGDEQLRILDAGPDEGLGMGCMTQHGTDVELFL